MIHPGRILLFVFAVVVCVSTSVSAQCSAPTQAGVRICAPSPNSTVVDLPAIQFNSTPGTGVIQQFIVYDNGKETFRGDPYQSGVVLYDGSIRNGTNNVVVNAWDSAGHLYQASVTFYVTGYAYPLFCAAPTSPGINFCVPPADSLQRSGIPVSATATGFSKIWGISLFLDGKFQFSSQGESYLSSSVSPAAPGQHRVTMVAYDSTGHQFSSSKTVRTSYDYYSCPPKGSGPCSPGFQVDAPSPDSFVENSFTVKASILENPRPITKMVAYIGSTLVAQSSGATMYQTVKNAPSGTHILTLQAWDTNGVLYRVQENININMPH